MTETARHLYLHIPVCLQKCSYCSFYSVPTGPSDHALLEQLVQALLGELRRVGGSGPWETVYLGGGTPSLLGPSRVARLLTAVGRMPSSLLGTEVTLEVNPETVSPGDLAGYVDAGVNRFSIGLQSLHDRDLAALGRVHNAARGRACVEAALATGSRVSIDLMYARPDQTLDGWQAELADAVALGAEHLSAYELTVPPESPLGRAQARTPAAVREQFFFVTHELLARLGLPGYEVSSFAAHANARSRHNLATWAHLPYLGLGPGAHSFLYRDGCWQRRWNAPDVHGYLRAHKDQRKPPGDGESLSPGQRAMERVMLGLRTAAGIDLNRWREDFPGLGTEVLAQAVARWADAGLVTQDDGYCRPTLRGMAQADGLAAAFAGAC